MLDPIVSYIDGIAKILVIGITLPACVPMEPPDRCDCDKSQYLAQTYDRRGNSRVAKPAATTKPANVS